MERIFQREAPNVRIRYRENGIIQAIVDSKRIGNFLTENFGTFRTLRWKDGIFPETSLPLSQLLESKYAADFLSAAFSCDGGVSLYPARRVGKRGGTQWLIRTVFLACMHPTLTQQYKKLLEHFYVKVREESKNGKLKIEKEEDIRQFRDLIGFIPCVKVTNHSKFWRGREKNEVLNLLINSYGQPSTVLSLSPFNKR